jgi:hypothetical protein
VFALLNTGDTRLDENRHAEKDKTADNGVSIARRVLHPVQVGYIASPDIEDMTSCQVGDSGRPCQSQPGRGSYSPFDRAFMLKYGQVNR